jgi:cation:H+ antiporter
VVVENFVIVVGGALVILALAEAVIRYTLRLARHFGLSGSFVGLTILSIGTSLLEIAIHVMGSMHILRAPATMDTMSALLIGNNIGSDIFQQNVVLPVVGLIGTVVVVRRQLAVEVGALVAASTLLLLACLGGTITRLEGVLLAGTYVAYLVALGRREPRRHIGMRARLRPATLAAVSGAIVLGFVAMAAVAQPVVAAAGELVAALPLSASMFGVLVLGICAALPELMTALVSIRKGQRDISVGILIGSNVTNPLLSVGLGAMISGYTVPAVAVLYDLPVKIGTGVLIYAFLYRRADLSRGEAAVLLLAYAAYVAVRWLWFPRD